MSEGVFRNPRILAVLFLGFSSGLPLGLTGATLQAWFTTAGVDLKTIGALSLLGLPYVWKFLWAPLFDRWAPPFLGRRRGWIGITQLGLCVALWGLAHTRPDTQPVLMGLVAFVIAFFSASQDIAIDAYRTDVLLPAERGTGAAVYIFAYRMAMLVAGGLALVIADRQGWQFTYELMAVLIAVSSIATYFAPEVSKDFKAPRTFGAAVLGPIKDLFRREQISLILLFIVFYKMGDALALSLMSNFLLRHLGFSLTEVGVVFKTFGLAATILGAFAGGILLTRLSLYRALLVFGLLQAFSNLTFMVLAMVGKDPFLMTASIFIEAFCSGMSTAAFVAFLMSLCNHSYTATQFAVLTALSAIGRVFLGPLASLLVDDWGWVSFFGWSFVLSFPGIILLTALRNRVGTYQNVEAIV